MDIPVVRKNPVPWKMKVLNPQYMGFLTPKNEGNVGLYGSIVSLGGVYIDQPSPQVISTPRRSTVRSRRPALEKIPRWVTQRPFGGLAVKKKTWRRFCLNKKRVHRKKRVQFSWSFHVRYGVYNILYIYICYIYLYNQEISKTKSRGYQLKYDWKHISNHESWHSM